MPVGVAVAVGVAVVVGVGVCLTMGIVTYPYPETPAERKEREKDGKPMRFFSFTVVGTDADDRDESAVARGLEAVKKILAKGKPK